MSSGGSSQDHLGHAAQEPLVKKAKVEGPRACMVGKAPDCKKDKGVPICKNCWPLCSDRRRQFTKLAYNASVDGLSGATQLFCKTDLCWDAVPVKLAAQGSLTCSHNNSEGHCGNLQYPSRVPSTPPKTLELRATRGLPIRVPTTPPLPGGGIVVAAEVVTTNAAVGDGVTGIADAAKQTPKVATTNAEVGVGVAGTVFAAEEVATTNAAGGDGVMGTDAVAAEVAATNVLQNLSPVSPPTGGDEQDKQSIAAASPPATVAATPRAQVLETSHQYLTFMRDCLGMVMTARVECHSAVECCDEAMLSVCREIVYIEQVVADAQAAPDDEPAPAEEAAAPAPVEEADAQAAPDAEPAPVEEADAQAAPDHEPVLVDPATVPVPNERAQVPPPAPDQGVCNLSVTQAAMAKLKDTPAQHEAEAEASRIAARAAQVWGVATTVLEGLPLADQASESVLLRPRALVPQTEVTRAAAKAANPQQPTAPPPAHLLVPPPPPPSRRQGGIKCELCKQAPGGYRYKTMMVCMVCLNRPRDGAV